jgi:nucleotide-binding universal stress UspA family protein
MKITKILVPTDFSENAREAFKSALQCALFFNAEIHLIHAFGLPDRFYNDDAQNYLRKMASDLKEESEAKLIDLTKELLEETQMSAIDVKVFAKNQSLIEAVEEYVKTNQIDFIVMGTKGANNVEDMVFGSNTAKVIEMSLCPVLSIPAQNKVNFKKIVHAIDVDNFSAENLALLIQIAKFNDASITLLNVTPEINEESQSKFDVLKDKIAIEFSYEKLHFKLLEGRDVFEAIDSYIKAVDADLLVTNRKERLGFFSRLFDSSLSETLALYSDIALLSFKI